MVLFVEERICLMEGVDAPERDDAGGGERMTWWVDKVLGKIRLEKDVEESARGWKEWTGQVKRSWVSWSLATSGDEIDDRGK